MYLHNLYVFLKIIRFHGRLRIIESLLYLFIIIIYNIPFSRIVCLYNMIVRYRIGIFTYSLYVSTHKQYKRYSRYKGTPIITLYSIGIRAILEIENFSSSIYNYLTKSVKIVFLVRSPRSNSK